MVLESFTWRRCLFFENRDEGNMPHGSYLLWQVSFITLFSFSTLIILMFCLFFFLFVNVVCIYVGATKLINTCVIEQCSGLLMVSLNLVVCCNMKRHYVRRKLPTKRFIVIDYILWFYKFSISLSFLFFLIF